MQMILNKARTWFPIDQTGVLLLRVGSIALAFAVMVLLSQLLGVSGYGMYAVTLSTARIGLFVARLGFPRLLVQGIAASMATDAYDLCKGLLKFSTIISGSLCLAFMIVALLVVKYGGAHLQITDSMLLIAIALAPAMLIVALSQSVLRALSRHVIAYLPEYIIVNSGVLASVLSLFAFGYLSANHVLITTVAAWYLAAAVSMWQIWQVIPPKIMSARSRYQSTEWLKNSLFMTMGSVAGFWVGIGDVFLIGLLTDHADAGRYVAAQRVASLVLLPVLAIYSNTSPQISAASAVGNLERIRSLVRQASRRVWVSTTALTLVLVLVGPALFAFLGKDFVASFSLFVILSVGYVVGAIFGQGFEALTMAGEARISGLVQFLFVVMIGVADFLVLPTYGALGVAVVTAVGSALQSTVLWAIACSTLNVRCDVFA